MRIHASALLLMTLLASPLANAAEPRLVDPGSKNALINQDACEAAKAQLKKRCHHRHVEMNMEARKLLTEIPVEVRAELSFLNEQITSAKERFKPKDPLKDPKTSPELQSLRFENAQFVLRQSQSPTWLALVERLNNRNFELTLQASDEFISIRIRDRETLAAVNVRPDLGQLESEPWSEEYLTRRLPPECRAISEILQLLQ